MLSNRIGKVRNRNEKLPKPGAIVVVHIDRELRINHRWRRFIVESYPAMDKRYNIVTHLVTVRALDNGSLHTISGFYCEEIN